MKTLKFALAAGAALVMPVAANALQSTAGTNSSLGYLALTDTGTSANPNTGTIAGNGVFGTISGGKVYTGSVPGAAAEPNGIAPKTNYLAAGPSATSPATLTFAQGLSYVSFLWGSPDTYNTLVVNYLLNGTAQQASFSPTTSGTVLGLNGDGKAASASYVQFLAEAGEVITSLEFRSPVTNAFEAGNFQATAAAVPGPIAGAGLPVLFGLAGLALYRRRSASSAA